jgi:phospholipase C
MPTDEAKAAPVSLPPIPESFAKIQHFVVLMLENRSFDHLFGKLNDVLPGVTGLAGDECNYDDPNAPLPEHVRIVQPADRFDMPFDPPHEFLDVQFQLFGPVQGKSNQPNPPTDVAAMSGFVFRTLSTVQNLYSQDAARVMSYFTPDQIPVLRTLATEFAVFNNWHSSLPGPTWPNRFFVHAATSGGLNYSPSDAQIVAGFSFKGGTIYERLGDKTSDWHIYHDGLPQSIGIVDLRWNFLKQQVNAFNSNFRPMAEFETDLAAGDLAPYTFIEPNYDTGHNYLGGNSMHPLNDIRNGEALVKRVYEALRKSAFWETTMLIITFDEHGGFFDHVPPPAALPTGDDHRYADSDIPFSFDRFGVRVPAVVISAYTERGTIIGTTTNPMVFDHSSIPATVEKRFGLASLTQRDAKAATLDVALNRAQPRSSAADAPMDLSDPAFAAAGMSAIASQALTTAAMDHAPLSDNQRSFLALALACDLEVSDASKHQDVRAQYSDITTQKQAADYISGVMQKIRPTNNPSGE